MQKLLFCAAFGMVVASSAGALPMCNKIKVAPMSAGEMKLRKCELHRTRLQSDVVTISYGRATWIVPYATSKRAFPHANSRAFGGCLVSSNSPRFRAVKFCSKCRTAEKRWLVAHKEKSPLR